MAIKKVLLQKKIDGVLYDIYQKTSADIVEYGETTVAAELAALASAIEAITADDGTIDAKIEEESEALYNKIMGLTDEDTTISDAYDTLKEVADYLDAHGDVVSGFTTDIQNLQTALGNAAYTDDEGEHPATGLIKEVADLKAELDTAETGIKARLTAAEGDIDALETVVGDENSGLVKKVAELEAASTDVVASENNGYISVDGEDVLVYDDSAIAATKIVEDDTHKFCTATEKEGYAAAAKVVVAAEAPESLDEKDLLMLVIG